MAQAAAQPSGLDAVARAIAAHLGEGPYRVQPHEGGIRIAIDLANRSWWHLLQRNHLTQAFEVLLRPVRPGVFERTDTSRTLEWQAGVPVLGAAQGSVHKGRQWSYQRRVDVAVNANGIETPVDIDFSTGTVNRAIDAALEETGWSTAMDSNSKIGLWVALGAVGLVAAIGVALLVLWATGALG